MNTDAKENVEKAMFMQGRDLALYMQDNSGAMSNTEVNERKGYIPEFKAAKKNKNMLQRTPGFICRSSEGRVVRLLQPYDSDIFTDEPEKLSAQWGFVWSDDPKHALPFVAISTSPYMKGNVCEENGIFRALHDNIVEPPSKYPRGWEKVRE